MLYTDLLRATVFLVAGVATTLGVISVLLAQSQQVGSGELAVWGAWWVMAAAFGLLMGTQDRAGEAVLPALRAARTQTSLPAESPTRIALLRLWPIAAFAVLCGIAGALLPQIAAIGAGYAILIALLWRRRESAVTAIEARDGVRFYVEASAAHQPIRLVRTPGLYRDRPPRAKPPPPPPATAR